MSISLFQHNKVAYNSAVKMLAECKKAVIIHPTGTGKSFIGFKLCEDNPDKCICWISPSEYIFKTQIENLKNSSGGYMPENIAFFTYAKMMNMSDEEITAIQPDYIILDEFHRCRAEMWGLGVKSLLSLYPNVPILGLSVTAIRYLDNQRDMSDELFDDNIASEMTLGEAAAVKYYKENGNLIVSSNFVSADGARLGSWISRLRKLRKGQGKGTPPIPEQIKRLDDIGMVWELNITRKWDNAYAFAKKYFEANGDLLVPSAYKGASGIILSDWIIRQRRAYRLNELTKEQIFLLDKIGFVWDLSDNFDERFCIAKKYYTEHGFLPLEPKQCKNPDELHICQWLRRQLLKRNAGKLEQEKIDRLTAIGMDWQNSRERAWNRGYNKAKEYHAANGNLNVVIS